MDAVVSRSDAIAGGLVRYFTGKPCSFGHVDERYVCGYQCVSCGALKRRAHYANNTQSEREYKQGRYAKNRQTLIAASSRWNSENRARKNESARIRYQRDPSPLIAKVARRNAAKGNATPAWGNQDVIAWFYQIAAALRNEGLSVQVDHIVPLQSKLVCGLHCEANLQILFTKENITKGNRTWPGKA